MKMTAPLSCALCALSLWCAPQLARAEAPATSADARRAQLQHLILPGDGGHISATPTQRMTTRYTGESVRWRFAAAGAHKRDAELELRPTRWGRPGALKALAKPTARAARGEVLEIERGAVKEWYVNRAEGVEQSFLLRERPKGRGPVEVRLRVGGSLTPRLSRDGDALRLLDAGREVARYTKLVAFDARGARMPARMVLRDRELALQVEDARAVYPLTIDPIVLRSGPELLPPSTATDGQFGFAVAIYDGEPGTLVPSIAAVSAPGDATRGRVFIFEQDSTAWRRVATIQPPTSIPGSDTNARFGAAIAMDDSMLVVGAPGADRPNVRDFGRVFVYERPTTGWSSTSTPTYELSPSITPTATQENALLGASVALHYGLIAAGAPGKDLAYVAHRTDNPFGWSPLIRLTQPTTLSTESGFGTAISVTEVPFEGNRTGGIIVVGAPKQTGGGAAFTFTCGDTNASAPQWSYKGSLTHGLGASAEFGYAIAMFADGGGTVRWAIGMPNHNGGQGAVLIFGAYPFDEPSLADITPETGMPITNAGARRFGHAVSLDGGTMLVGAPESAPDERGAVFLFEEDTPYFWTERTRLDQPTRPGAAFGQSVAVGLINAVAGAPLDQVNTNTGAGTAYALELADGDVPVGELQITAPGHQQIFAQPNLLTIQGTAPTNVSMINVELRHITPEGMFQFISLPNDGAVTPDGAGSTTWQLLVQLDNTQPAGMYEIIATAQAGQLISPPVRFILGSPNALAILQPISNSFIGETPQLVSGLANIAAQVTLIFEDRTGREQQRAVGGGSWQIWPPGDNGDPFFWEYVISPPLPAGQWQLKAIATLNGQQTNQVGPLRFTVTDDTPALNITITEPQDNAQLMAAPQVILGSAPPEAGSVQVELRPQGSLSAQPLWSFNAPINGNTWRAMLPDEVRTQLMPGVYEINANAVSTALPGAMITFTITEGIGPVDRPIDDPDPDEVDADGNYTTSTPTLRGDAPAGATVEITIDDREAVTVTANANGRWSYKVDPPLEDGDHDITIRVLDEDGAEISASTFRLDVLRPERVELERKRCAATAPGAPVPADALAWLALGAGLALLARRRR